jgi:hypothetical protein
LRLLFSPPDLASRTDYRPGELAQRDLWFPPVDTPLGFGQLGQPPVLVSVSGYSRMMTARMIVSRQSPDLLAGHRATPSSASQAMRARRCHATAADEPCRASCPLADLDRSSGFTQGEGKIA